jgi:hypothetical protein
MSRKTAESFVAHSGLVGNVVALKSHKSPKETNYKKVTFVDMQSNFRPIFTCRSPLQGCQMVCFKTKNPNLGKFWRALEWKMLVYFMTIWNIIHPFGIIYGRFVSLVVIWYIFLNLVRLDQEKSGNPASLRCRSSRSIRKKLFFTFIRKKKRLRELFS